MKPLPADVLDRLLIERTRERGLARDLAVALEQEVARLRSGPPDTVLLRPWTDPVARIIPDGECACRRPDLVPGSHAADHCVPPEASDE